MSKTTKCAYCGRENVPITKKGYMKPHVKMDGRPCLFVNIPKLPAAEKGASK